MSAPADRSGWIKPFFLALPHAAPENPPDSGIDRIWGGTALRTVTCAIFMMVCTGLASDKAAAEETLSIATYMDFPPYITDTDDRLGVISDIVRESFAQTGINLDLQLVPWRRSYRAVRRGDYPASYSWAYSDERAEEFHMSDPVFAISNQLLTTYPGLGSWEALATVGTPEQPPILCVPIGWKVASEIASFVEDGTIERISPSNPRQCLELMRAGRTNIIYLPAMTALYHIDAIQSEEPLAASKEWPALYGIEVPSGLAVTQHVLFTRDEAGRALRDRFDAGLSALVKSGRYQKILEHHLAGLREDDRGAVRQDQIKAGILREE